MYFKQLELIGFKSFADRTVLRMEPGTTAVVGPNGCGKSNILDALRWVLGEQRSKELRGSHMQDVIFNGSENRRPLGMAEVAITFDNADSRLPVDFAEVQVSRRLYRSGESEYLLNRAPCRLKDVLELFMDTGIGTNAYSMIGQGKMDLILSQRPEDRRFLFEEAAGIIKYKNRKRVAMRRLDAAEQNLLRLGDIVAEVQRQMRSLKRQVNAAIRYRELSNQLREIEIRAAWLRCRVLTNQLSEMRERFAKAQDAFEESSTRVTALEARYEELGLAKLEVDRVLVARREGVHELDTEMEKLERQTALLKQQIEFSHDQQRQAEEERKGLGQRAAEIQEQMARTKEADERLRTEVEACVQAIRAQEEAHATATQRVADEEAALDAIRAQAVERMNERAKAHTELETLAVSIANIDGQLKTLCERQEREEARRKDVLGRLEAARRQETEKHQALAESESRRAQAAAEQEDRSKELRALNDQWQGLREQKSSLEARLNSLRELRDNYEGFAIGVRAVMRAKAEGRKGMEGIIGPAGDLLSTEKKYERAIEAALGGNINNVVVEHAEAAKGGVAFLKEHRAGRVTFLPLDIIRGGVGDQGDSIRGRRGVIGPAIDVVQYDPYIQKAVEQLLHSTLIVEDLDVAIQIAREEPRFPRLVTLDGEVVSAAGAVTGGRTKHESRGLLGRSAEIDELEEKVQTVEGEISQLAEQGEVLTAAIHEGTNLLKELDAQENALSKELGELGVLVARQTTELESLSQSMAALGAERDALDGRRLELDARHRDASDRAECLDSDDETLRHQVAEAQSQSAEARNALAVCTAELGEMRVRQAELNQRIEEVARDRGREQRSHEEALREMERRREQIAQQEAHRVSLEEEIRLTLERAGALSESKEEARVKVVEAEQQRQQLLDETDEIDKELRSHRDRVRELQGTVHQLELNLRSHEDKLGFFQERILTEYHVALASLSQEEVGEDEYDEETREKLVADIRDRLQRMGEVNLMAIEEYDALEKRNEFLTGQSKDLEDAREVLLGVIARNDKKIREMFMETFDTVANHFREFFRRLFNGGQARVYLLDEDDPLESGIEIEARPPGKKPTSISLLSGGESALTAIALLFGILKAKPTPFCVLDEVDAPLDDVNIGRFLKILDEFTQETQFVIITHNKQTMARADAMYGVTMQERGVSQLISAKLQGLDEPESAA